MLRILFWLVVLIMLILSGFSGWALMRETGTREELAPKTGMMVKTHDVELFIQAGGTGNGRVVILIHGMAAWSETWRATMDALIADGYRVIAVDMPPFGFSERPWDRSYWREAQGRRLVSLVTNLKLERPIIVAHSYGSRGALEAVMSREELFGGLVLVDPALDEIYAGSAAELPTSLDMALSYEPFRYGLTATTMTNPLLAQKLLQSFMHKKDAATADVVALYQKPGGLNGSTTDFGYWIHGFLAGDDSGLSRVRGNFARISIPTTIVWGREDTTTPLEQGMMLHEIIPQSSLVILDGVGHMPHLEDPSAFNAALVQSLSTIR